ncbi:MAG: ABC transporter permease [Bacteroidetes bacterium]|nr:ABC transporter permease [Bacteroidota bacterium]
MKSSFSALGVIFKSEFIRRFTSKSYILTTLLMPFGLAAFIALITFISLSAMSDGSSRLAIIDESGQLGASLEALGSDRVTPVLIPSSSEAIAMTQDSVRAGVYAGVVVLPDSLIEGKGEALLYTIEGTSGNSGLSGWIRTHVSDLIIRYRLAEINLGKEVLTIVENRVGVESFKLADVGVADDDSGYFVVLGFLMAFLIYMAILLYGSFVMQAVVEEKSTRIVEIIISSARPFDLLMGKVLGVGMTGLVQMGAWALMLSGIMIYGGTIAALFIDPSTLNLPETASSAEVLAAADIPIPQLDPMIFAAFVLFFLMGYLMYASLFAAVGSAVENVQDAQSLTIPLMLPIILAMAVLTPVIESPDSTLATIMSHFPLTSPIIMMVRISITDIPIWEVGLSLAILLGSFLGAIWFSGRIYRVGVLSYGKKPSLAELIRWARM